MIIYGLNKSITSQTLYVKSTTGTSDNIIRSEFINSKIVK